MSKKILQVVVSGVIAITAIFMVLNVAAIGISNNDKKTDDLSNVLNSEHISIGITELSSPMVKIGSQSENGTSSDGNETLPDGNQTFPEKRPPPTIPKPATNPKT